MTAPPQTRPGPRSSPRHIPSGPRGTTASTPLTSRCCGCGSATCQAASRSRAKPRITEGPRRAPSTRSRSHSPSSSRHASGPASIIGARMWRASCSAGTSPGTGSRTTCSRSVDTRQNGPVVARRPASAGLLYTSRWLRTTLPASSRALEAAPETARLAIQTRIDELREEHRTAIEDRASVAGEATRATP